MTSEGVGMLEDATKNTARNIANGILLQVCDLQKLEKPKDLEEAKSCGHAKKKKDAINQYTPRTLTLFAAELLGTGLMMFLGCMGCIPEVDSPPAFHHMASLSFGLVILIIIQGLGHISGAHLNPSVTIAAVLMKLLHPLLGVVYIAAQFIGAFLGFGLLKILIPESYVNDGLCVTSPHKLITTMQALALETIITTVLILVVLAVWDKRNEDKPDSLPLRFGFVVAAISMVAGPLTGASMNTARTLAPAVLVGNYKDHWIYWVGPNVGAIIACGIYKYIFALPESEEAETVEETFKLDEVRPEKM